MTDSDAIHAYWQESPCADRLALSERGTRDYFREIEQAKNRLEPFELAFAEFSRWRDRAVLEIGCGIGTDTVRFARAGARVTAVDLTEAAVQLTQSFLAQEQLEADVLVADATALPFESASFDLVYSWGVIHHTADPAQAVSEIQRVLRPGGEARLMLYSKRSFFAAGVWVRHGVGRRSLAAAIERVESPGTRAYSRSELQELLASFAKVEIRQQLTPYDSRVGGPLAQLVGDRAGWFFLVRATL